MFTKLKFISLMFCIGIGILHAQQDIGLSFEDNFRLHPGDVSQTEVFIAISPQDDNILFSSCNTLTFIPFFISEGIYVTTDGGSHWSGNDTCTGEPISFHGGDPGIAIDKNGTFVLSRLGRAPFSGLYSHYSTDNGQTWSAQQVISTDDLERAVLASDIFPSSPYYGRTYAAWVKFSPPYPMTVAYTDDGGISWSESKVINNPPNRSAGGDICIGSGGEVYICWAGVANVSPFEEIYVGFASSQDGGNSWNVTEEAFAMNGITGLLPEKGNIRVNGLPNIAVDTAEGERHGWIYIVSGQENLSPAGTDPDIILNRSTDDGSSWSSGIRVNQDPVNNGKIQYFPNIHVDKYGAVDILFYDDRNTTSDSAGVFLARSSDGGGSWMEYEISDHNYKPEPIGGLGQGYQGDNIDLTSSSTTIWPVWMDNSSGIYQIWTTPLNFSSLDFITESQKQTIKLELKQNRPNPFKDRTTISYSISKPAHVSLKLFDVSGKEVLILVNENKNQGNHEATIDAGTISGNPGIYFYTLSSGNARITKKMLLLP